MKGIIDYIKKYGASTIEESPFCEVDSLILSQLSYLKFDGIVPSLQGNDSGITLKSVAAHPDFDELFEDKRYEKPNRALFNAAAKSNRFGNMLLNNYINLIDTSWEIQFSAMTFTFENGLRYVAFRGTDETLIGWKEDFNMALFTPIPAQEKAQQYLNQVGSETRGNFIVGGHSKGGNLAVYSSALCYKEVQDRILCVYNHDGPGFYKSTLPDSEGFARIRSRVRKYMPHSSIVGMLMDSREPYEIIECRSFGILQHDPFNWVVYGRAFKRVKKVYKHVAFKDESINQWIDEMSDEERQTLVDELYKLLSANGSETLLDIMSDWKNNSKAILETIENTDPKTKEIMRVILTELISSATDIVKLKVAEKVMPGWEKFVETASDVMNIL